MTTPRRTLLLCACASLFGPSTSLVHDGAHLDDVLRDYRVVTVKQLRSRTVREAPLNPRYSVREESFAAFGRDFRLVLAPKRGLLAHDFRAFGVDGDGNRRQVDVDQNFAFEGFVYGEPSSKVQATYEDGRLNAKIVTADETYYVEPSDRHLNWTKMDSMIVYKESDVKDDISSRKSCGGGIHFSDNSTAFDEGVDSPPPAESFRRRRRFAPYTPTRNTCPLLLVADHTFFVHMGKGDVIKTISYLVALIDRVDSIYRRTTWNDLGMTAMGFEIKEIIIHEESNKNHAHYNHHRSEDVWNVQDLLESFSRHRRNQRYCLAHLFTHQGFLGYVLGLAYIGSPRKTTVGGICTKEYKSGKRNLFLNTGLSSTKNVAGRRILTREADLVTAHELGHNWGSEHDPDTEECSPKPRDGGSYIMYTYSVSGMERNNRVFSPCSKRSINAALESKSASCFARKSESFCGNSHKEPGEECDAGVAGKHDEDKCCTPKCKLRRRAVCSPSNSPCCADDCQFRSAGFVCAREDLNDRTCTGNATCPGDSDQCGQPRPKPRGSPCMERGQCNAEGACLSYCQTLNRVSCVCANPADMCKWCCKSGENATCEPQTEEIMPEGSPCPFGYCNSKGECKKIKQDMIERFFYIIEKLDTSYMVKIMRRNIVGTILIFSALIWIPASCIITWVDRKQEAVEREEWEWYMKEHFVPANLTSGIRPKIVKRPRGSSKRFGAESRKDPSLQLGPGVHFEGVDHSDWDPEGETTPL